jgi:hypothetical protein
MSLEEEQRYDNVQIINIVDGTIIEGHDAVKMQFEREQKMLAEYGGSIIFQVYQLNLQAGTFEELLGKKLAEIKVDGNFVSEVDTVAVVKDKVRSLLKEKAGTQKHDRASTPFDIKEVDHLTLYLSGRPLQDDSTFYADNPIMLPVWIQVLLHHCDSKEAVQLITRLQR